MCPYTLRVHLFAGKSDLRIQHTFVFDQEPHDIELSSIGMRFPLDVGGDLRAAVGGEKEAHFASNWEEMSLLQSDDQTYAVTRDGEPSGSGGRSPGWASLGGDRGGAVIVVKNAWQEYPKGFTLDQDGIDVEIWPRSYGSNLTFTTPFEEPALRFSGADGTQTRDEAEVQRILAENPTAPLNLKSFNIRSREDAAWVEEVLEKYAQGRTKGYNDTGTMNGMGAAKTTEIYLRLSEAAIEDDAADALAQAVEKPLVGIADPAHISETRALGHFFHSGDPRFSQVDDDLENIYERVVEEPVGILSCRHGVLHREFTGPLSILTDVYQATWERKYGEVAERSLNWLLRASPEPGRLPNSVFTRGERGDEAVVQAPTLPEVAWGNKYHLYEPASRLYPSKTLTDFLIAEAADKDPDGFAAAAEAWWGKRREMPDREPVVRPDAGPGTSLGRLSTEPHPE